MGVIGHKQIGESAVVISINYGGPSSPAVPQSGGPDRFSRRLRGQRYGSNQSCAGVSFKLHSSMGKAMYTKGGGVGGKLICCRLFSLLALEY